MTPLLEDGDYQRCVFRHEPIELRFALDPKVRKGRPVLRYRYCPYFPPDFGHRFHIGSDNPDQLERNCLDGNFRDKCADCRFMRYYADQPTCTAPQPSAAAAGSNAATPTP